MFEFYYTKHPNYALFDIRAILFPQERSEYKHTYQGFTGKMYKIYNIEIVICRMSFMISYIKEWQVCPIIAKQKHIEKMRKLNEKTTR
jgi:hypothetical protein